MRRGHLLTVVGCVAVLLVAASPARAFDALREADNFSKINERERYVTLTPGFQTRLQQQNAQDATDYPQILADDPERDFAANICAHRTNECAGDVRFYDWQKDGFGLKHPVLFTARDGATISGTVWATRSGPPKRPGVVITTGSVQAPETLYWGLAATLAKHGYVVLTYDVQGQGRSDTFGQGPDQQEGVPAQAGQPFYDGTEDALDFLLSSPNHRFEPRRSCGNANGGVARQHFGKQRRRVKAGLNAPYNPFWKKLDHSRIGIAGHSLGAGAVSYIGQLDPRVDAIVAWDNLSAPDSHPACPSHSSPRPDHPAITKPALGMSADYFLVPEAYTSDPDPQAKNQGFLAYQRAGVDSMEATIRGGTHYEFSFLPGNTLPYPLGTATLRGMDMVAWYTTAWLDRYVKCGKDTACKRRADARLLTNRWRDDAREGEVDPNGDPNLYSFYYRSRYALRVPGAGSEACANMRAGCASMKPDGLPPNYRFNVDATRPDSPVIGSRG
jgi:dienelactone hydrolase